VRPPIDVFPGAPVGDAAVVCDICHAGSDDRPLGLAPPVTQPSEACGMCHDHKRYKDDFPFKIHKRHAGRSKCYTCHQTMPQLFDWPEIWLNF